MYSRWIDFTAMMTMRTDSIKRHSVTVTCTIVEDLTSWQHLMTFFHRCFQSAWLVTQSWKFGAAWSLSKCKGRWNLSANLLAPCWDSRSSKKTGHIHQIGTLQFSNQCWSEIMTVLSPQPCYDYSSVSTVKFTICTVDSTSGDFSVM